MPKQHDSAEDLVHVKAECRDCRRIFTITIQRQFRHYAETPNQLCDDCANKHADLLNGSFAGGSEGEA